VKQAAHGRALAAAVGILVGTVACLCRAPGVLYADAGEFLTAIAGKGVAHPPGFPLYLVAGGWWLEVARLFRANPASALNAFSSVCAGVVAAAAVVAAGQLVRLASPRLGGGAVALLAAGAGLLVGFGPTLFDFSLGIEVYAFHMALLASALACAVKALAQEQARDARRWTLASGLFAGGALAVHHATMIVTLPGLAVLLWRREDGRERRLRVLLFSAGLIPGLLSYVSLPLRALRWPALNWGNPSNLFRFWVHVTARDYQVNIDSSPAVIASHAGRFMAAWREEVSLLGILLAVLALAVLWKRARHAVLGLWVVILGDVAFAIRYEIAEDQAAYYLPTFLASCLLLTLAAAWLCERLGSRPRADAAAAVVFFASAGLFAGHNALGRAGRAHDRRAPESADDVLASLPAGALAFTPEWNLYAPVLAAHEVDGRRPDVLVLDLLLLRRGWYLDSFARRFPERRAESGSEFETYRTNLADWEEGRPYDGDQLTRLYDAFTQRLVRAAWARAAPVVWIGTVMTSNLPRGAALVPYGIGYRVLPDAASAAARLPDAPVRFDAALLPGLPVDEIYDGKIRPLYAAMLTQRALYEVAFRRHDEALEHVQLARRIDPTDPGAAETLADFLAREGKAGEAVALYAEALKNGGDSSRIAEKSRALLGKLRR
jgi:tetratricopeptide (TPR) repeat protein